MAYPRRRTGRRLETTWDKWFRILTEDYGFDGTRRDPGTANTLATAIAQDAIDPTAGDFSKVKRERRKAVYQYYKQYCSETGKRPASKPKFTFSLEARKAVALETQDFKDSKFKSDRVGDIYDRYYYGDQIKVTGETLTLFKRMLSEKSKPSKHTREYYGK